MHIYSAMNAFVGFPVLSDLFLLLCLAYFLYCFVQKHDYAREGPTGMCLGAVVIHIHVGAKCTKRAVNTQIHTHTHAMSHMILTSEYRTCRRKHHQGHSIVLCVVDQRHSPKEICKSDLAASE